MKQVTQQRVRSRSLQVHCVTQETAGLLFARTELAVALAWGSSVVVVGGPYRRVTRCFLLLLIFAGGLCWKHFSASFLAWQCTRTREV